MAAGDREGAEWFALPILDARGAAYREPTALTSPDGAPGRFGRVLRGHGPVPYGTPARPRG
ncbi:hypothetical protein AB0L59_12040 [Streptomyces sp. NPDC052109]|uniref:hypothetical protein n=1 Tax=Streptomyces sp. NPDC052109 TaxID=3155527 RepID=UPI0034443550